MIHTRCLNLYHLFRSLGLLNTGREVEVEVGRVGVMGCSKKCSNYLVL